MVPPVNKPLILTAFNKKNQSIWYLIAENPTIARIKTHNGILKFKKRCIMSTKNKEK